MYNAFLELFDKRKREQLNEKRERERKKNRWNSVENANTKDEIRARSRLHAGSTNSTPVSRFVNDPRNERDR